MNIEKLKRLQTQVRIGGKGTARRKKKVMHQTATTDDKKLQSSLKKLSVSTIPGIEEVNIIKDDLTVIHFNNPKAQASLSANTFAVTGHGETKKIVEMLPEILPQLGQETVVQLRMFANTMAGTKKTVGSVASGADANVGANMLYSVVEEDDVPMLVSDFDEVAKLEAAKTTIAPTTKSEQPANASEKPENVVDSNAEIKETVAVPPILPQEISHAETIDDAVKKVGDLQPLENSDLNNKLSDVPEQKHSNLVAVNNEKDNEKQQTNLNQQNTTKIEKGKNVKDVSKSNDSQKKIENKNQQKQDPTKQKAKPEAKTQKGLKENKKSDDATASPINVKTEEKKKVIKTEESAQGSVGKSNKPLQQQQQKQVKSAEGPEKQQKKDKQPQQPEQNKELKQQQQKQADVAENKEKLPQPEKSDVKEQQTIVCTKETDIQPQKLQNKPDQQQQPQQKPKQAQQQQKSEQQIKQKIKPGPQKPQNPNQQSKTDIEPILKKTEAQRPTSNQPSAKQQDKGQTSQLKATGEKLTDKKVEPKKGNSGKQILETATSPRKPENIAETQVKGLPQPKEATPVALDDALKDSEQKPKAQTPPKVKQQDEKIEEKLQQQQETSAKKDNQAVIATDGPIDTGIAIADISIKTVALQSLQSTEKVLGLVNEITKELAAEDSKEGNAAKKEVHSNAEPQIEQQQLDAVVTAGNVSAVETVQQQSGQTEQMPSIALNVAPVTTVIIPVSESSKESNVNIVENSSAAAENLTIDSKGQTLVNNDKSTIEANGNIPDTSSNAEKTQSEVIENKDITEEQPCKGPTLAQIIQSQTTPPPAPQKILDGQLDKQPSSAEVGQIQPEVGQIQPTAILPLTLPVTAAETSLSGEEKPNEPIAGDLVSKLPTLSEVIQTGAPQILSSESIPLEKSPLADEVKDNKIAESLDKIDIKAVKSESTVLPSTEATKLIDEVKVTTPERTTPLPENKNIKLQNAEKKSASATVSSKQKTSPPKQAASTKDTQESPKQQKKEPVGNEASKAPNPDDAKLKLTTKPQPAQQQQSQPKGKPKPPPSNKSAPASPTTPTKTSPEKSVATQKPTTPNTKSSIENAAKKTTSPQQKQQQQQQQQVEATAKSKQAPAVGGKVARPGSLGNASATSSGVKKSNTPPTINKTSIDSGGKQQAVNKQENTIAKTAAPAQPVGGIAASSTPTAAPAIPATESTATSKQSPPT